MIRNVHLTQIGRARVWNGEQATIGYPADGVLAGAETRVSGRQDPGGRVVVGLEALCPRGARAEYGLLGLTFVPGDANRLDLEVPYSKADGTPWAGALAGKLDQVSLGLPEDYAAAVLEALQTAAAGRLPSGTLRVSEAAHGAVGSSRVFFGKLGRAAAELLVLGGAADSDASLAALLRPILWG